MINNLTPNSRQLFLENIFDQAESSPDQLMDSINQYQMNQGISLVNKAIEEFNVPLYENIVSYLDQHIMESATMPLYEKSAATPGWSNYNNQTTSSVIHISELDRMLDILSDENDFEKEELLQNLVVSAEKLYEQDISEQRLAKQNLEDLEDLEDVEDKENTDSDIMEEEVNEYF